MEWLVTLVTGFAVFVLLAPLLVLLVTVFVLVPLAHLAPRPAMIARSTFECPFSKHKATAEFLTSPDAERPVDVVACSLFAGGPVRCAKGCLALGHAAWAPSPAVPRYALIAGGTTYR
jgi:hypothetical protein